MPFGAGARPPAGARATGLSKLECAVPPGMACSLLDTGFPLGMLNSKLDIEFQVESLCRRWSSMLAEVRAFAQAVERRRGSLLDEDSHLNTLLHRIVHHHGAHPRPQGASMGEGPVTLFVSAPHCADGMTCVLADKIEDGASERFRLIPDVSVDEFLSCADNQPWRDALARTVWNAAEGEGTLTSIWLTSDGVDEVSVLNVLSPGPAGSARGLAWAIACTVEGAQPSVVSALWSMLWQHDAAPKWARTAPIAQTRNQHANGAPTLALELHSVALSSPFPVSQACSIVVEATADAHVGFVQHGYVGTTSVNVDASALTSRGERLATACSAGPVGIWCASVETIERLSRACAAADGGAPLDDADGAACLGQSSAVVAPLLVAVTSPASSARELHPLLVKAAVHNFDDILAACVENKWTADAERKWPCCGDAYSGKGFDEHSKANTIRKHVGIKAASYQKWPVEAPPSTKRCTRWYHDQLAAYMGTVMGGVLESGLAAPAVIDANIAVARATILANLDKPITAASGAINVLVEASAEGSLEWGPDVETLIQSLLHLKPPPASEPAAAEVTE